ncbi:mucin-like protein [Physella acuta]|uniref:mucin-like protein n=1 Tax=Physella acuta TaxID=109671 RepID=UPI0027DB74A8|nr:mucin-like protein [Physella acuta]
MNPLQGVVHYHLYEKCEPSVFSESDQTLSPAKQNVMNRASKDVITMKSWADFDVNTVLVVTWENQVSVNDQTNTPNTFQAIFISGNRKESSSDQDFSDEETSFVLYLYPKDKMRWCNNDALIGVSAGSFSASLKVGSTWLRAPEFREKMLFKVGQKTSTVQQCQRYLCKNSRQITNPVYRQEIEQLYKCPCTLDRLGLQWGFYEQRSPDIYCFSIRLVAKRRLLISNPRNKLCCYKWNKPADNSNWQFWAQQLALATFVHSSGDAGHVIPGDPEWYVGVRENINAHQWCCKDANKAKLCERFDKIYPDMDCSYDVEFVPGYLLGDPTIVTLDNVTYLMNGWGEYILMDVPTENFTLQARTDRIQTSKGLSNGTVFTAFAAMEGIGSHFQVELSDSKRSMEILAKGVSMIVRVGVQSLELEMQVVKTLKNKTRGLLGNFNGKTNDEFTLPNGTILSPNLTESQIFYSFANQSNSCPNVSISKNENYTNGRWYVQEGVVNTLRINATDADNDMLTYMMYENVTGVSVNQSGFLFYTPSSVTPVKIGFRVKDAKSCYTPVVNVKTAICPLCRNNGRCNKNVTRSVEYFGGQIQILKCDCAPGFTGDNCESELDACLSKPCSKGKNCTDLTAAQQGNSTVGYVCGPCPKGFVDILGVCVDIDECENNSTCQHKCENTEGSFVCGCNTGYVLNRTDSRTCLAKNCSNRCVLSNTLYCDESISVCVCKNDTKTADCSMVVDYCSTTRAVFVSRVVKTGQHSDKMHRDQCFSDIEVEGGVSCPYDSLKVYSGASTSNSLLGVYCGSSLPISISSFSGLYLVFTSDRQISGRGFKLQYSYGLYDSF